MNRAVCIAFGLGAWFSVGGAGAASEPDSAASNADDATEFVAHRGGASFGYRGHGFSVRVGYGGYGHRGHYGHGHHYGYRGHYGHHGFGYGHGYRHYGSYYRPYYGVSVGYRPYYGASYYAPYYYSPYYYSPSYYYPCNAEMVAPVSYPAPPSGGHYPAPDGALPMDRPDTFFLYDGGPRVPSPVPGLDVRHESRPVSASTPTLRYPAYGESMAPTPLPAPPGSHFVSLPGTRSATPVAPRVAYPAYGEDFPARK